jgi:hypothetical protein
MFPSETPAGWTCAFKGFLKYVIANNGYNPHWKSYEDSCQPCAMNFNVITKQESSVKGSGHTLFFP